MWAEGIAQSSPVRCGMIPALPGLTVLFQRPTDIVISVRDGSVDPGITGLDVTKEHGGTQDEILVLHEALGFGGCRLAVAVPDRGRRSGRG